MAIRNINVEQAVRKAIERVDDFISGEKVVPPSPEFRRACDTLISTKSASVVTASLYLLFYWLETERWDGNSVPTGSRGQYGDKKLCEELSNRSITLHKSITAYGENLGWKGNVSSGSIRLTDDNRFKDFFSLLSGKSKVTIRKVADYLAFRFAESKKEASPLPPVGDDVLTFTKAKQLFHTIISLKSEGHIQQFLIAALLFEYKRRHSLEITTHHPHAADTYDDTAGDVEEKRDGKLVRAYEVTVRDDWRNRISRFREKMDQFGLAKYIIIASNINEDADWSVPATMALKLQPYKRDIAVIDIHDVVNFLAAELTPQELRAAVNKAHGYLTEKKLSGRHEFIEMYTGAVQDWLDTALTPTDNP